MSKSVYLYVDGFNFYYAIKNNPAIPIALGWCDFRRLVEQHFLASDESLERIKYFTAFVGKHGHRGEVKRQKVWLRAVQTIRGLDLIKGVYVGGTRRAREEKQTDVNIAVELVLDAMRDDGYDRALLLTADTDLIPAAVAARRRVGSGKPVTLLAPPGSTVDRWVGEAASAGISLRAITPDMLRDSRLPDEIADPVTGKTVQIIDEWRL